MNFDADVIGFLTFSQNLLKEMQNTTHNSVYILACLY